MFKQAFTEFEVDVAGIPVEWIAAGLLALAIVGNSLELTRACEAQSENGLAHSALDSQRDEITASCIRPPGAE